MHTLHTSVHFVRRKTMNFVTDEHDTVLWSGPNVADGIEHLIETGNASFKLQGARDNQSFVVTANRN